MRFGAKMDVEVDVNSTVILELDEKKPNSEYLVGYLVGYFDIA